MQVRIGKLSLCALVLPLVMLGTSAQAAMTGAQIKAAMSGKSFSYKGTASVGTVTFRSNGVMVVNYNAKGRKGRKTGKWWVSGDKSCTVTKRRGPDKICSTWTDLGGGRYKTSSGSFLKQR